VLRNATGQCELSSGIHSFVQYVERAIKSQTIGVPTQKKDGNSSKTASVLQHHHPIARLLLTSALRHSAQTGDNAGMFIMLCTFALKNLIKEFERVGAPQGRTHFLLHALTHIQYYEIPKLVLPCLIDAVRTTLVMSFKTILLTVT